MEQAAEQMAKQLMAQLNAELNQNEDAETAIDIYKTVNWIVSELEEVKEAALDLAQQDMEQRGLDTLKTPAG